MFAVGAVFTIFAPNIPADENFMLIYFCSMITAYGAVLLIERMTFKRLLPVYNSKAGFDPVAILLGVVLIFAISIVLLPLEGVMSADSRVFPNGPCTLISVVLLAPIFEEMIFRARLYNILSRNTSPLMSASLSAVVFGAVHMQPIVVVEALLVGVILSYFYLSKRSIIAPIILHIFNNAFAYALTVLSYRGESLRAIVGSGEMQLIVYLVATAIVVCGAIVILRFFVKEKRRMRGVECQDMETLAEHHNPDKLID
jgi:membrane protease YdiL (CAAX protease family)